MTHICVCNLTIIGPDNGLSPGRRQAIIWTTAGILLIGPWGTNFSEILISIHTFSFKKIHLKMLTAKWRPSCLGLNVLKQHKKKTSWDIFQITPMQLPWYHAINHVLKANMDQPLRWYCFEAVSQWTNSIFKAVQNLFHFGATSIRRLWKLIFHDGVIKWKHFPRYWPFVWAIHRSPVNSPHKGQCRRALKFSLICVWINGWVNNREAGDLRRYHAHHDVTVMSLWIAMLFDVQYQISEISCFRHHWWV